jgi:hypothetical protein
VFDGWVEKNVETVLRCLKRNIHISENERYDIPGFLIYCFSSSQYMRLLERAESGATCGSSDVQSFQNFSKSLPLGN